MQCGDGFVVDHETVAVDGLELVVEHVVDVDWVVCVVCDRPDRFHVWWDVVQRGRGGVDCVGVVVEQDRVG